MDAVRQIFNYLSQGGAVMIPLVLCSCVMWTLILERVIYFYRLERRDLPFYRMLQAFKEGVVPDALDGIRVFLVRNILENRTGDPELDGRLIEACAMSIRPRLTRFLSVIAVLAAVAPLFGLLGTVTGMITTFNVITLFGTGNARAMAGGISEALVTTQSGLMVSIPGLFMSVMLWRRAFGVEKRLQEATMMLKRSLK